MAVLVVFLGGRVSFRLCWFKDDYLLYFRFCFRLDNKLICKDFLFYFLSIYNLFVKKLEIPFFLSIQFVFILSYIVSKNLIGCKPEQFIEDCIFFSQSLYESEFYWVIKYYNQDGCPNMTAY